jgi:hypothetical protein
VQEAQDKYPLPRGTRIEEDNEALILIWKQDKHRRAIPFHPLTNTPSFRTAPASPTYCAFVALCKAAEVQYYRQEHVLQMPGRLQLDEEFMAEENLHVDIQKKPLSASEGAKRHEGASKQPFVREGEQDRDANSKDGATYLQCQPPT